MLIPLACPSCDPLASREGGRECVVVCVVGGWWYKGKRADGIDWCVCIAKGICVASRVADNAKVTEGTVQMRKYCICRYATALPDIASGVATLWNTL